MERVSDERLQKVVEDLVTAEWSEFPATGDEVLAIGRELQELRAQSRWVKVDKDFEPDYGSLWMVRCYDPEFPSLPYTDFATYSMMGGWCVGHGSSKDAVVTHIQQFPLSPEEDK